MLPSLDVEGCKCDTPPLAGDALHGWMFTWEQVGLQRQRWFLDGVNGLNDFGRRGRVSHVPLLPRRGASGFVAAGVLTPH